MGSKTVYTCDVCKAEGNKVRVVFVSIVEEDGLRLLKDHTTHICYTCWSPDKTDDGKRAFNFGKFWNVVKRTLGGGNGG